MFVDASAMVAMLTGEADAKTLFHALGHAHAPITSTLAMFEAVVALSRKKAQPVAASEGQVREFLETASVSIVPLTDAEGKAAFLAWDRFGKGRGHPARLNMGDCFAYACARTHDVPLLFVGDDFTRTDIRDARA